MEIISAWDLYLWTRLDGLQAAFVTLTILSGVGALIAVIAVCVVEANKKWLWAVLLFLCFLSGLVLTPSSKDMAMIYVIPKIMNNENIQNEASEIYTMAKDALKEYLPAKGEEK